jgi:hypothetical protein
VVTVRNPATVESRTWAKLEAKLVEIQRALTEVMEEPEDLMQLVLGMTNPTMFEQLFSDAPVGDEQNLARWFDARTATFGGRDIVEFVKSLAGSCARFDFEEVSEQLPKTDLPDLKPFFLSMLKVNGRMVQEDSEGGIQFISPEKWRQASRAIRERYSGMHFNRRMRHLESTEKILAVGNPALENALRQAKGHDAFVATLPRQTLESPTLVYQITDAVTGEKRSIASVIAGVVLQVKGDKPQLLRDWEVLQRMNTLSAASGFSADESPTIGDVGELKAGIEAGRRFIEESLTTFDLPFRKPKIEFFVCLWPRQ